MITQEQALAYASMDRHGVICKKLGYAAGLFVLGAELYVAPRELAQLRLDMLDVQEDYWRRFNGHLDSMLYETEKEHDGLLFRLKKDENPFPWVRQAIGHPPPNEGYCNVIRNDPAHPDFPDKSKFNISAWQSSFYARVEHKNKLSDHVASIPVSDGNGGLHFDIWRDCVLTWAKRLRPAHGLAGLSVVMNNRTTDEPYIYPTLKKYIGLDVQTPLDFTMETESVHNRIKCVNWLTILGDAILKELGGLAIIKNALEPECTLHPYPGGVMIQAGEAPRLGDVDVPGSSELLEPYRKVASLTKPVRFMDYKDLLFRVDEPLNDAEEAKKWVSRFD
ncbi:MAG: DUF3396 domain-containing protein [Azoarcus sp.]|jgi:hypothetical protein|nr:DUF3396 domain-containing protein [Azoarcus sp.]